MDLNVKCKTIKLLDEIIGEHFWELLEELGKQFLDMTPKTQFIREKTSVIELHQN